MDGRQCRISLPYRHRSALRVEAGPSLSIRLWQHLFLATFDLQYMGNLIINKADQIWFVDKFYTCLYPSLVFRTYLIDKNKCSGNGVCLLE